MLTYLHAWLTAHARSERGASAVEYGLLVAGVLTLCIAGWEALSHTVQTVFSKTDSSLGTP